MSNESPDEDRPRGWLADVVTALERAGGVAPYADIYREIQAIRPGLPEFWKSIVRRTIQQHSSDAESYLGTKDVFYSVRGIGGGIWGLRSMVASTPTAVDIAEPAQLPAGKENPERSLQTTYRKLRDTELARKIKLLHGDACQVCGTVLQIGNDRTYSEAHHVIPLSKHNGPDTPENIVVLCPNHHALLDYGAIPLDAEELISVKGHEVSSASIDYHNERIYGQVVKQ